jgi:hypothetical protein
MNDFDRLILAKANKLALELWYRKIIEECGNLLYTDPDILLKRLMQDEL